MTDSAQVDRITHLEIKLTYQDDVIRTLNDVVIELRGEIERMERRVTTVEQHLRVGTSEPAKADEPPPHY